MYTNAKLFEIELIIYIKLDLALNNLQRLICHKIQPTNHRLHLCPMSPGYNTKRSDEAPMMLEIWGIWSTLSSPLLPGPLWPGMVAPDRALWCK